MVVRIERHMEAVEHRQQFAGQGFDRRAARLLHLLLVAAPHVGHVGQGALQLLLELVALGAQGAQFAVRLARCGAGVGRR